MRPDERFKLYKPLIKVQEYEPERLTDYMHSHYTCEDITEDYKTTFHYQVLMETLHNYHNAAPEASPVFLRVTNDEKSMNLYKSEEFDNENYVYVFIDKESGFFETPSFELAYELTMEAGVSQEDYDNDTLVLLDALARIEDFMCVNAVDSHP